MWKRDRGSTCAKRVFVFLVSKEEIHVRTPYYICILNDIFRYRHTTYMNINESLQMIGLLFSHTTEEGGAGVCE